MGESPCSTPKQEDGELSNDDDLSHLFVVDSTPAGAEDFTEVPVYDQKFKEILDGKKDDAEASSKLNRRPPPPRNTCWNCGGDHSLRDCTEPKNWEAINQNRNVFRNKQASRTGKSNNRYHLDDEQKFAHFQPGKISKRLRKALGLEPNQLPRHVYRMRVVGYPPGWVEAARVSHSGLSLFDSDGQEVADPQDEDGEIVIEGGRDKYDIRKIVEYPGFNCPCGPDIIDESDRLNIRPMAEKDSIKFMKRMWKEKAVKGYKRKRMNTSDTAGTPSTPKNQSCPEIMELDSNDKVVKEKVNEETSKEETQSATPSQGEKRSGSPSPYPESAKKQKLEDTCESEVDESATMSNRVQPSDGSISDNTCTQSTPKAGNSTSMSLGTPVIVTSEFTRLPSADKFSKNICDVINFENLPDSTGKYEKMSGLLQKVRSFRSKLELKSDSESEDDEEAL